MLAILSRPQCVNKRNVAYKYIDSFGFLISTEKGPDFRLVTLKWTQVFNIPSKQILNFWKLKPVSYSIIHLNIFW